MFGDAHAAGVAAERGIPCSDVQLVPWTKREEIRAIPRTLQDKLWYQGMLGDLVVVNSAIGSGEYLTPQRRRQPLVGGPDQLLTALPFLPIFLVIVWYFRPRTARYFRPDQRGSEAERLGWPSFRRALVASAIMIVCMLSLDWL